jgi:hypothetical protein
MNKISEFSFTAVISTFTGALVAFPVLVLGNWDIFPNLLKSGCVGAIIGISVRIAFSFFYRNLSQSRILPFCIVFIIIAAGTCGGAYILGLRDVLYYVIMTTLAEMTGMLMAISGYNTYIKLNKKLCEVKKRYQ